VALSDTRLLCEMLQPLPNFEDAIATAHSTAEFYTKRKPVSATINTLANALYKVSLAGCSWTTRSCHCSLYPLYVSPPSSAAAPCACSLAAV